MSFKRKEGRFWRCEFFSSSSLFTIDQHIFPFPLIPRRAETYECCHGHGQGKREGTTRIVFGQISQPSLRLSHAWISAPSWCWCSSSVRCLSAGISEYATSTQRTARRNAPPSWLSTAASWIRLPSLSIPCAYSSSSGCSCATSRSYPTKSSEG